MSRSRIIAGKAVIVVEVLDNIQKSIGRIQSSMRKVANTINVAGEQAARTGLFGSILSGLGIREFSKFEDSMLFLQTKIGIFGRAVGSQKKVIEDLENTIRELGRTTSFTSTEVAEGAATLAQGGFTPREIKDTLSSLLDLSRASRTEINSTAKSLINALRSFSISTEFAPTVASQFIRATRAGTLDLEDLTTALKYVQGSAASMQQSLPTMLALIAQMSNRGLIGSIAGTSTNTALSQIANKLQDIQGTVPGFQPLYGPEGFDFPSTLQLLFDLTKEMELMEKKKLFQDIFNLRGERSVSALQDIDAIFNLRAEILAVRDEAKLAAKTMDQGLGGSTRIALSAIQELALTIDKAASVPISNMLKLVQELSNKLGDFYRQNSTAAVITVLSPAILLGAGVGSIALAKSLNVLAGALSLVRSTLRGIVVPMAEGLLPLMKLGSGGQAQKTAKQVAKIATAVPQSVTIPHPNLQQATKATYAQVMARARHQQILEERYLNEAIKLTGDAEVRKSKAVRRAAQSTKIAKDAVDLYNGKLAIQKTRVKQAASVYTRYRNITKDIIKNQKLAAVLRTTALTPSLSSVFIVRAMSEALDSNNAKLIAQAKKVQALQAPYLKWLELTRKIKGLQGELANVKSLTKQFPSAKIIQRRIADQIKLLSLEKAGLSIRKGASVVSPEKALQKELLEYTAAKSRLLSLERNSLTIVKNGTRISPLDNLQQSTRKYNAQLKARNIAQSRYNLLTKGSIVPGKIAARYASDSAKAAKAVQAANRARDLRGGFLQAAQGLTLRARTGEFFKTLLTGARGVARAVPGALSRTGTGFLRFFQVLNGVRRFIPSWWTLIDILILFGDKIPVVSTVLSRFGAAFVGSFKEIGKIGAYMRGPLELLKAAYAAFSADRGDLGIAAVKDAFLAIGSIIRNQLIAAWEIFKAKLDEVWSILRGIGVSLFVIFTSVVESIRSVIDSSLGSLKTLIPGFTGNTTDFGDSFISGFRYFAEITALFLNSLPYIFAIATEKFQRVLDYSTTKLLKGFAALVKIMSFGTVDTSGLSKAYTDSFNRENDKSKDRIGKLIQQWEVSGNQIRNSFKDTSEASIALADKLNRSSQKIELNAFLQAQSLFSTIDDYVRNSLIAVQQEQARAAAEAARLKAQGPQAGPRQDNPIEVAAGIVSALVGSPSSFRRGQLNFERAEQKQVELLEQIRDDQRAGLRQGGGVLLPIGP